MTLNFATGNAHKKLEVESIFVNFNFDFITKNIQIDEIQNENPDKITEQKARDIFEKTDKKNPVVVNDSSWQIPALNGFPGGYMHDIGSWLTEENWLDLMRNQENREIILTEKIGFFDGKSFELFTQKRSGKFVKNPSKISTKMRFDNVVKMDGMDCTIAENFTKIANGDYKPSHAKHWENFAKWYENYLKDFSESFSKKQKENVKKGMKNV